MKKIYALQKALGDVGIKSSIHHDVVGLCTDGKIHCGIELTTEWDIGEDNLSFVFHPKTHKLVGSYLECPVIKENS